MSRTVPAALALAASLLTALALVPPASGADPDPGVRVHPVAERPRVVVDPAVAPAAEPAASAAPTAAAAYPLSQTFLLHSLPGAARTIYVDFDGMDVSGTRWNTAHDGHPALAAGPQPGWSLDASPAFSDAERTAIQDVWQAVAEDYAPFAVDVTTEPPPTTRLDRSDDADREYGATALVTGGAASGAPRSTADDQLCGSGCGGLAYDGAFDNDKSNSGGAHAEWLPVFVFPEQLQDDTHAIADGVSHEIGHTFGLDHDGTTSSEYFAGQGAWGPIMGAPSTYPVTQWSRGEYANADQQQDDLAIIGAASGAPTRADDAPATVAAASPLPAPSGTPSATGIISAAADVDVFSLGTCTGRLTLDATPAAAFSPDVDLSVSVLGAGDTGGTVLAGPADAPTTRTSRTVAAGLGASLSYDAGTTGRALWVAVDGVGSGDPRTTGYSDYGSLGRYLVGVAGSCTGAGTTPSAPTDVTATVSGTSLTVGWAPPSGTGGSAVTAYRVSLSPGGAEQVVGATTRSATFTGLTPGQQYAASVTARNADTVGPPGTAVATVPAGVPGAPTEVRATAGADGTAVMSWAAPASDGGAAVSGYRVAVPGLLDQEVGASVKGLTVTGLQPGAQLTFVVSARNTAGAGPAASVAFAVPAAALPAAPVAPAAPVSVLGVLARPTVSGPARVGKRVRVAPGRYSTAATLTYRWYAAGRAIPRATAAAYRPKATQVGTKLRVRVTATAPASAPVVTTLSAGRVRR